MLSLVNFVRKFVSDDVEYWVKVIKKTKVVMHVHWWLTKMPFILLKKYVKISSGLSTCSVERCHVSETYKT